MRESWQAEQGQEVQGLFYVSYGQQGENLQAREVPAADAAAEAPGPAPAVDAVDEVATQASASHQETVEAGFGKRELEFLKLSGHAGLHCTSCVKPVGIKNFWKHFTGLTTHQKGKFKVTIAELNTWASKRDWLETQRGSQGFPNRPNQNPFLS